MKTVWIFAAMLTGLIRPALLAQPGLTGEYYNGMNFETKVMTRVDSQITFLWTGRRPAAGIDPSCFSVRWTGKLLAPASGKYVFSATVDDGVRIWVDNKKILDAWPLNIGFKEEITLEAGKYYDLRVEYFNNQEDSFIMLVWQRPDDPKIVNRDGKLVRNPTISPSIGTQYLYQTIPLSVPPAISRPTPASTTKPVATSTPSPSATPSALEKKPITETFGTLEVGKALVLRSVFFEQSTYVLLPESFPELDKLVRTLQQNPAVHVGLVGHTDNVGDPRLNQSLSEYRARVIMNYLIRHGIAPDRVDATGYGGSRPLTGNATEADRAKNRRVEFVVK